MSSTYKALALVKTSQGSQNKNIGMAAFGKATQWEGINRKQSTRWQHLSRLKASAFFSLQFF
jgi:hypothetical protein